MRVIMPPASSLPTHGTAPGPGFLAGLRAFGSPGGGGGPNAGGGGLLSMLRAGGLMQMGRRSGSGAEAARERQPVA